MNNFNINYFATDPVRQPANAANTPVGQNTFSQFSSAQLAAPASNPASMPAPAPAAAPVPAAIQAPASDAQKSKISVVQTAVTALSLVTAGFCLYKTGKTKKALDMLQQNTASAQSALLKAQQDLTSAQNAAAKLQKNHQKMINNLLFPNGIGNLNFHQSNIGDCYLLSSLYGLSRNPKGRKIIQNMVTINPDGDFVVKFYNKNPIIVTPSQIKGQTIKGKGTKRTVFGDMGVQAIECAYGKYRRALAVKNGLNNASLVAIDGGSPADALKILGGLSSNSYGVLKKGTLESQGIDISSILDNIADNFSNRIVNAGTPPPQFAKVQKPLKNGAVAGWMDQTQLMPCRHAYNIKAIDKLNKTVTVVNPHCTSSAYTLSYENFAKVFGKIYETVI